jgi:hypothetical protein
MVTFSIFGTNGVAMACRLRNVLAKARESVLKP